MPCTLPSANTVTTNWGGSVELIMWDSDFPYFHPNSSLNTSALLACLLQGYIPPNHIFAEVRLAYVCSLCLGSHKAMSSTYFPALATTLPEPGMS